jgi:hypothetical protein
VAFPRTTSQLKPFFTCGFATSKAEVHASRKDPEGTFESILQEHIMKMACE